MAQQFFQAFFNGMPFNPQQAQPAQQLPEYIIQNDTVLEIINNWDFVIDLMNRHKEGKLQRVDDLEKRWYDFIISKQINMLSYKNKEEFFEIYWKIPDS
jgi:hypothetical protein